MLQKSIINPKLEKYQIHQGEIIKIGRILTKIKQIKFDKNKNKIKPQNNTINSQNKNSSINTKSNNNIIYKEIDKDSILNEKNNLKKKKFISKTGKLINLANQRSATDANLKDAEIIYVENARNNEFKKIKNENIETLSVHSKKQNKEKICRICYMEEENELENPIVQPCHCSGSCKYIHLNCLKQWINTKSCLKVDQNEFCSVFLFTETECEICKTKFPDLINHNGKLHSLLDFSDEFSNYLILESLTLDKEKNKFLYVISLENNGEFKIGRGQMSDILLSDASISRVHCLLSVEGKNIYIKDNDSKFGTLILIQTQSIKMVEGLPLYLQVGRTFCNFSVIKKSKFFGCCGVAVNPDFVYYYRQNEKQIKNICTIKTEVDKDLDEEENSNINDEIKSEDNKNVIEEVINETIV